MRNQFLASVAVAAIVVPGAAYAQSTGTIDAEEIVVTGSRTSTGIQGVQVPDSPKARTVLSNELLRTQTPGQSILNAINIVPSVNFTSNDPFGSSGGNVRIRGFDGNRISFTWDGLPLNDTGNYAIFSNQSGDPEIVDSVNVNQGTTDVDSPTAASSGGTINYRTIKPSEEAGAMIVGAYGGTYSGRQYTRVFGKLETGDLFGTGIRAFITAASAKNDKFRGVGVIDKQQYNIRLYKEFDGDDFISIAGHYNQNRNSSYRALSLYQAQLDFGKNGRYTFDNNPLCARATPNAATPQFETNSGNVGPAGLGTQQPSTVIPTNTFLTFPAANFTGPAGLDVSCTNYAGVRINPSNTGNIRFNSKATLTDKLTLSLDMGYQYVLANGGGFTTLAENSVQARGGIGDLATGRDFNGDGNVGNFGSLVNGVFVPAAPNAARSNFIPDTIAFYAPNNTNTNRYTVLSSLRYDVSDDHYVRLMYAFDYGRHRQTGEWSPLDAVGDPVNVFGGRRNTQQVTDANAYFLRGRDRFSIASLSQISGEYRGKFFDNAVELMLGVRAPFFKRELNQFCYTVAATGNPLCTSATFGTAVVAAPNFYLIPASTNFTGTVPANALYAPFKSTYKYNKVLPNIGLTLRPMEDVQIYAAYAKGLSAPRTDNLYRKPSGVDVQPETTDNFDIGIRYTTPMVQASFGGFLNKFSNRIVTSFDSLAGISVDRNVGRVEIKGLEASLNVKPFPWFSFRGFASYIDAKLKDDIRLGTTTAGVLGATVSGLPIVALTAGKKLVETPEWQYGFTARANQGPVSLGVEFKQVTSRFATDVNDVILPGYNTVNLDARLSMKDFGLEKTFLQLNVSNVFNQQYLGSISSQIVSGTNVKNFITNIGSTFTPPSSGTPTFQPGAPRAFILSLQVGF
jgi:iron complex outermembrane recepter protein